MIKLKPLCCKIFLASFLIVFTQGCSNHNQNRSRAQTETKSSQNWPSFRGQYASGVMDGQSLPDHWDGVSGENITWKTRIPGLAHSSPIVWDEKLFVTTAVSSKPNATFRHGLYGDGDASDDKSIHRWQVICLDKKTGEIKWQQTAVQGVPKDKRHIKATYANSTPATDGRYVVAFFGSEGVYVYDMNGNFIWKKDLGILNAGAYDAPSYEWGSASSPIIYHDLVILQCDTQNESYVIACDIKTGETVWKSMRDELPSWGTPTIFPNRRRVELVTNASNFIRSYNPLTGEEIWRLGGSSKITAPTPIFQDDLLIVASGRRPEKPIFAIRTGGTGDITLQEKQTSNDFVKWSKRGRGPYMPTPIIYQNQLYCINNNGVLDSYNLQTGDEIYRQRVSHRGGGFSASPIAADGKIYLPGEDGDIFVVKTGTEFNLIATNSMGELLMATPAISDGLMYVRAQHHLFAIGK